MEWSHYSKCLSALRRAMPRIGTKTPGVDHREQQGCVYSWDGNIQLGGGDFPTRRNHTTGLLFLHASTTRGLRRGEMDKTTRSWRQKRQEWGGDRSSLKDARMSIQNYYAKLLETSEINYEKTSALRLNHLSIDFYFLLNNWGNKKPELIIHFRRCIF